MTPAAPFTLTPPAIDGRRIGFLIPGEVTDGFLSQIAMFSLALRRAPAPVCHARVIAYLGHEAAAHLPDRWRPHLANVDIRFVQRPAGKRDYAAQAGRRFTDVDPDLDYVILCDADTLVLGDLDDVLLQLAHGFPVAGVVAHFAPPDFTNDTWHALSARLTGSAIRLPYVYTLMDPEVTAGPGRPRAPFYVNHGFLAFRADALRTFSDPYRKMRATVTETLDGSFFAGQIALSLALHALDWRGAALAMRYNFPNDDRALKLHACDAGDIRFLHYLRERNYKRTALFADPAVFDGFMAARPACSDRFLFDALGRLTGGQYPF